MASKKQGTSKSARLKALSVIECNGLPNQSTPDKFLVNAKFDGVVPVLIGTAKIREGLRASKPKGYKPTKEELISLGAKEGYTRLHSTPKVRLTNKSRQTAQNKAKIADKINSEMAIKWLTAEKTAKRTAEKNNLWEYWFGLQSRQKKHFHGSFKNFIRAYRDKNIALTKEQMKILRQAV